MVKLMVKLMLTLFLAFMMFTPTQVFAQNEIGGFRGMEWGQSFEKFKNEMIYLKTDPAYGGVKLYTKENDKLQIGAAHLEIIIYYFWQEKLSAVGIETKGSNNFNSLKKAAEARYGGFYKPNEFIEESVCSGKAGAIFLKYNDFSKRGTMFLQGRFLAKQQKEYEERKASEGASDF